MVTSSLIMARPRAQSQTSVAHAHVCAKSARGSRCGEPQRLCAAAGLAGGGARGVPPRPLPLPTAPARRGASLGGDRRQPRGRHLGARRRPPAPRRGGVQLVAAFGYTRGGTAHLGGSRSHVAASAAGIGFRVGCGSRPELVDLSLQKEDWRSRGRRHESRGNLASFGPLAWIRHSGWLWDPQNQPRLVAQRKMH